MGRRRSSSLPYFAAPFPHPPASLRRYLMSAFGLRALRFVPSGGKSRYITRVRAVCLPSCAGKAYLQTDELQCGERQIFDRAVVVEENQTMRFAFARSAVQHQPPGTPAVLDTEREDHDSGR